MGDAVETIVGSEIKSTDFSPNMALPGGSKLLSLAPNLTASCFYLAHDAVAYLTLPSTQWMALDHAHIFLATGRCVAQESSALGCRCQLYVIQEAGAKISKIETGCTMYHKGRVGFVSCGQFLTRKSVHDFSRGIHALKCENHVDPLSLCKPPVIVPRS